MNKTIFLDNFSTRVSELTRKQKKEEKTVLKVLEKESMVSSFEIDRVFYNTVKKLIKAGYLVDSTQLHQYPWCEFRVTRLGKKFLKEQGE